MQRRAAALYGAFFLVLALGSYGMIVAASAPTVSIDDPDHTASDGDELTIGGRTYGVAVDSQAGSAELSWTNQSGRHTATWENGSTVSLQTTNFSVATVAAASPKRVELTEVQTLGETVTTTEVNGTEYVVLGTGENRTLVARDTYLRQQFGPAETRTIAVGDTVNYRGNSTTLTEVTNSSATLEWTGPKTNTVEMAEGDVVILNGREFVAHFPDAGGLELSADVEAYERQLDVQDTYDERINGLWGVSLLSGLAVVVLLAFAYLPSRY